MKTEIKEINAQLAQQYLEHGRHNRRLSMNHARSLANEMTAGRWKLNGDAIRFDREGKLIDGQHRLMATILAETSLRTLVIWDVDETAFDTIDSGKRRRPADVLSILGEERCGRLATALSIVIRYEENALLKTWRRLGHTEVEAALKRHPGIRRSVELCGNSRLVPPGQLAAMHYLCSQVDANGADRFIHKLITGEDVKRGDPVLKLRQKLESQIIARSRMRIEVVCALIIRVWNATRRGEQLSRLCVPTNSIPKIV